MNIPYVKHEFDGEVTRKLSNKRGWITAGVASSIPWPIFDVCITYSGDEYFLLGSMRNGISSPPCIALACESNLIDQGIEKIYRITSILSWFKNGYVNVFGYNWGSSIILFGSANVYSLKQVEDKRSFSLNHMPIIESENTRIALAFWREGELLFRVQDSYSFLSFYKVIESQFPNGKAKGSWITSNICNLNNDAAKRVKELEEQGIDVSRHLFDSGRCAVAHASTQGQIIDPDIVVDKKRISADLIIIKELARLYIKNVLGVPDQRSLDSTRNKLEPWDDLLSSEMLHALKSGQDVDAFELKGHTVSVGLWAEGPIPGFEKMTTLVDSVNKGIVAILLVNERGTVGLPFFLDYPNGRVHIDLAVGGYSTKNCAPNVDDVRAYSTFFYKVFNNRVVELTIEGKEPIDCEIVIPVNMRMTKSIEQAIEDDVQAFSQQMLSISSAKATQQTNRSM